MRIYAKNIVFKFIAVVLAICMVMPGFVISVFAELNHYVIIKTDIQYDQAYENATIVFDMSSVDDKYQVKELRSPDDEIIYDSNHMQSFEQNPEYRTDQNGSYKFTVLYTQVTQEQEVVLENDFVIQVTDIGKNQEQNEASETNAEVIQADQDDFLVSLAANPINTSGNILELDAAFNITGTAGYSNNPSDSIAQVSGDTLSVGTGEYHSVQASKSYFETASLTSKFAVDFNRSFILEGSANFPNNPDGITLGFTSDSSWRISNGGGALGVYNDGTSNGVPNAIIYEVDLYNNKDTAVADMNDYTAPHIGLLTTDGVGSPTVQQYVANTDSNISSLLGNEQFFKITYDATTQQLTFNFGDIECSYIDPRQNFNGTSEAYFLMTCAFNQSYYTDGRGKGTLTVSKFAYTDEEPVASTKYYSYNSSGEQREILKSDVSTYAKKGEKITVKHTIYNNIDAPAIELPIRISAFTIGGTEATPTNIQINGATVLDQDIANGTRVTNGLYKTASFTLPANHGTAEISYDYTLNETVTNESNTVYIDTTILLGKEGMTQYPFSETSYVAGIPTITDVGELLLVEYNGSLDDGLMSIGVQGRLYDENQASLLETNTIDRRLTYTYDTVDTKSPGQYTVIYTLMDTRTGLTSESKLRTVQILEEGFVASPDGTTAVNANDVYMKQTQAKALLNEDELKDVMGATSTDNQNGTPDITVTAENFDAIQAGMVGTYPVTFTVGTNDSQASITKNLIVIPDDSVVTGDDAVYATGTTIQSSEANALEGINALKTTLHAKGYVKNVDITDTDDFQVEVVTQGKTFNHVKNGETGVYEVKFTAGEANATVQLTVVDDAVVVSPDRTVTLSANHKVITVDEAKAILDKNALITLHNAHLTIDGTEDNTVLQVAADMPSDADFINKIQAGVKGTYSIKFVYDTDSADSNKHVDKTVILTITDSVGSEVGGVVVFGNHFRISVDEVAELLAKEQKDQLTDLLQRSGAKTQNLITGTNVEIVTLETAIEAVAGTYDVTFRTAEGAQVTVQATVYDIVYVGQNGEVIYLNNFEAKASEIEFLMSGTAEAKAELIRRSGAIAVNTSTGELIEITDVDASGLQAYKGDYTVTFGTVLGIQANAICTVTTYLDQFGNDVDELINGSAFNNENMLGNIDTGDDNPIVVPLIAAAGISFVVVLVFGLKKGKRNNKR